MRQNTPREAWAAGSRVDLEGELPREDQAAYPPGRLVLVPGVLWLARPGDAPRWSETVKPGTRDEQGRVRDAYRLEWRWRPGDETGGMLPDDDAGNYFALTDGALAAFLSLGDLPPETFPEGVRDFARAWGPLCLCSKHQLPATHAPGCEERSGLFGKAGYERISGWEYFVRRARLALAIASELHRGRPGSREAWEAFAPDRAYAWPNADHQWAVLSSQVSDWLDWGAVRPWLVGGRSPRLLMSPGRTIFGAIALQLASRVARAPVEQPMCAHCGQPITRARRPREGYRAFCDLPECKREGRRLAKRDERAGRKRWTRRPVDRVAALPGDS